MLVDLTPARVRARRAGLLRAGQPGPSTIAKAYRLLSGMMATAVVDNLVARNPCVEKGAGVERPPEMSIATPEQVGPIAAAVEPRYRALVLTAAYAGCRWGELVGLRRKNLDLAKGALAVVEQVVELREASSSPGSPNPCRDGASFTYPAGLIDELEAHMAQFVRPNPDSLVFTSRTGGPLRQSNFRNRQWIPALGVAGIDKLRHHDLRHHDLRHVAGTLATVSGATIREVQSRLGHASSAAAYRYQHVLDTRDAQIAERLELDVNYRANAGSETESKAVD